MQVVTYVAGVGDISTDLLSPGSDAHSRSDRELHGQSMFEHDADRQQALLDLQAMHPDKRVMLVAEKGTMGVGSSRMSGVNNVALWIGRQASPYVPFINIAPVVAGTNGVSPIFLTTVDVTGGIGLDLKNWKTTFDADGELIVDADGEALLMTAGRTPLWRAPLRGGRSAALILPASAIEAVLYAGERELERHPVQLDWSAPNELRW